jgi:hypothetical protein
MDMSNESPMTTMAFEGDRDIVLLKEEERQGQLLRTMLLALGVGVSAFLVLLLVVGALVPAFPAGYLVPIVGVFGVVLLFTAWMLRRGHRRLAAWLFLGSAIVTLFAVSQFINGVTGPLALPLAVIPVVAALLVGRTGMIRITLGEVVVFGVLAALEALGILQPWQISGLALQLMLYVMILGTLVIVAILIGTSVQATDQALAVVQRRGQELAVASRAAQEAAQAEREAREREEQIAGQLRRAMRDYAAFLGRVSAGDYGARLELAEIGEAAGPAAETAAELRRLGQQLNETVETLVRTLADLQTVQRRYVREAWEEYGTAKAAHRGFRFRAPAASSEESPAVEPADEAWLGPMAQAVKEQSAAVGEQEVALPITLRGEVIGAIGVRREDLADWSAEELALAEAVTEQLAQTMETLRLVDETQQRAAQGQLMGQITARMRETLDVRTVIEAAADEIYQRLGLDKVAIHLAPDEGARPGGNGDSA